MERARALCQIGDKIHFPYKFSLRDNLEVEGGEELKCGLCQDVFANPEFLVGMYVASSDKPSWYHPICFWEAMKDGTNRITVDMIEGVDSSLMKNGDQMIHGPGNDTVRDEFFKELEKYNAFSLDDGAIGRELFEYNSSTTLEETIKEDSQMKKSIIIIWPHVQFADHKGLQITCNVCAKKIKDSDYAVKIGSKWVDYGCALYYADAMVGSINIAPGFKKLPVSDRNELCNKFEEKKVRLELEREEATANKMKKKNPASFYEIGNQSRPVVILSTLHAFEWKSDAHSPHCAYCPELFSDEEPTFWHGSFVHPHCLFGKATTIFELPEAIPNWSSFPDKMRSHIQMMFNLAISDKGKKTTAVTFSRLDTFSRRPKRLRVRSNDVETSDTVKVTDYVLWKQICVNDIFRDTFAKLEPVHCHEILKQNKREISENRGEYLDDLADILQFGPPLECPLCKGVVRYSENQRNYICKGSQSFRRCDYRSKNPRRGVFTLPNDSSPYSAIRTQMTKFGRRNVRLYAEVNTRKPVITKFSKKSHASSELGGLRVPAGEENSSFVKKFRIEPSIYEIEYLNFMQRLQRPENLNVNRFIVKGQMAIREECAKAAKMLDYHIVQDGDTIYHALLTSVEIQQNKNMCMELYLLQFKTERSYWVIKIVSRIGTCVRKNTRDQFTSKSTAIQFFEDQFHEFTHNHWENREQFEKHPNGFFYVDHSTPVIENLRLQDYTVSKKEEQELRDFVGIDVFPGHTVLLTNRFLFGKLSPNSYQMANNLLQKFYPDFRQNSDGKWDPIEATNKFYSILPTCSGYEPHKLLDSHESIQHAFHLLHAAHDESQFEVLNLRKIHQEHVQTKLTPLDPNSVEWNYILEYHGLNRGITHDVDSEIVAVYTVKSDNFFDPNTPRTLLWHGTKVSKLPEILKNGLKVPIGYRSLMFGSGIYFSDCFTKSVFYCRDKLGKRSTVYMLLCEVVMKKPYQSNHALDREKLTEILEEGYDSVLGTGSYSPCIISHVTHNNVLWPIGGLVGDQRKKGKLAYNEMVIFDDKQVRVKYVVELKVQHAIYK